MTQRISWQAAEEREGNPVQNFLLDAGEKLGFGKKALAPWEVDPESGTNVLGDTITYQGKNKEQYNSEANQAALRAAHAANRNLVGEASVKLDTDSGKVTVTAPKGVMESDDFKKAINTDVLKQASQAYRTNKDYKLPYNEYNTETGKLEEKEITVPEYIEKINESLKSIANNMLTADAYRSGYSSQWNKKADDITESQIRMSIDYKGDYVPIPHFITRLDSFRGTGIEQYIKDGYIKKEDLKKFYNRDKLGRDELAVIMGALESGLQHGTWNQDEYYQDEDGNDVFDTYNANEMARAIAFRNYMLENDPEQSWLQSVWSNVETAYVNFSAGATSVVTNIANMGEWAFTGGQGHAVQDYVSDMDTAMDKYNEQNKLVNDATAATAWLSYIGGVIAGTWATGKVTKWGISGLSKGASAIGDATIGKSVEATMAKAGIEAGSAASQALTAKTMIQLASQAENVGRGALFAMRVSDFGFKLKMVTDVARAFMLNHSTLNTAVSFLLDTLHDAILYDSTTLRGVLESSDQDTKDYWMGQLAENGKWWMGMAGARGLIKNAGKTSIGKWADAHISKYINQKAASVGDKWASIKDKLAGGSLQDKLQKELDDLLDEGKASKARKAKKIQNKLEQLQFNQQLRSARREFGNLKIERENWHTLKLSDKTARELAAKKNAVRALDISIDAYNRNIQYKRQEMLGVIPRDPYTGLKNLYINPGLGGSNAKTSEFYFKLAKMNEAAGLGRVDNSFLSQDVIDYLMGSYDFRRYSNLSAPGAAEAAENAKINIDALREKLPDNIVKFIDDNAGIYTEFYDELNKYAISHRLLDRKRINGYKNETWDKIGGYQPVIVAQDTVKGVRRSIDTGGEVAATIDQEMRELTYQVKVGQHYIDPELTRQSRISRIAQAEINRNMLDNYMRNTGASFSEHVTGTETEFVREVKQGRKTLEKALADRSENFVQDFNVRIRRRALEAAEDLGKEDMAKINNYIEAKKKVADIEAKVKEQNKAFDDEIKSQKEQVARTRKELDGLKSDVTDLKAVSELDYDTRKKLAGRVATNNQRADGYGSEYTVLYRVQGGKPDKWRPNNRGVKGKFEATGGEESLKGAVWLTADDEWAEGPERASAGVSSEWTGGKGANVTNDNIVAIPVKNEDILFLNHETGAKNALDESGKKIVKTRGINGGNKKSEYILWENEHPEIFEEGQKKMLEEYNKQRAFENKRAIRRTEDDLASEEKILADLEAKRAAGTELDAELEGQKQVLRDLEADKTLTADQIKKAYDLKEPVAPKKPVLKATDDQIKKWVGESFTPDVHINLVEDFLGRPILDIAEEDFDSFIKGLDSNSKKVIRDAIRQNSKTASTAYNGAAKSTGEITRAQAIKNLKIKTSSYREATGLGYKDAPDWIKPLLSEKNGETLDIIGRRVFGDKMTAAGGNTTLDIDDTLEELERIMGRRTNAKGTLDWVSWEELVNGGNYEVLEDLKANLAKSMVENDYRGIWNYKNESDPEAVPIREWGTEAVNEGPLNEYYEALDKYEAELAEYNAAKGKMEAEIAEMQDVVSGKVDEVKEYTPYKNKVIKQSVREKVVAELTFDDTTDALYAMDILGNDRPLMTSGVDEENYWDWYNSLNKKAQVYVNEQTMEYGKSGYASLRMAMLAGGQDFEYGLRRAYLLGDADYAKSGIMNEAARRLERGQDALMDGVYALKAKNELRKIMDVDTDRFVDDLMITYKKAVNTYIDKMTRSVGIRMASNTMSFHMVASDTEIEHMVLSQLKSKHRGDIMDSIRKEVDAITDGKSLSKDDVKKLTAQAEELFDEYLDSRIATDAHAIKAAGGSAVDSKAAYEEVKRLDEEIRGAKEAVNQNNTGMIMYVDGQGRQAYATVDPAFASLYNRRYRIDGADASAMAKINAVMSKTFRYGTTSVNFSSFGNQLFRDFGNAVMVGGSWKTIKAYADEMRDVFGSKIVEQIKAFDPDGYEIKQLELLAAQMGKDINTAAVSRELMRGAAIAPSSTERTLYKDLWKNLKNDSNIKIDQMDKKAKQILDKYNPDELLNGKRENYLRNRVYAANLDDGLKNGYSLRDSRILAEFTMNNATTNFGRQLYHLQSIAESTPYFRAAINGTKSFWRMWMLDPVGISGRITGGLILPTMYLVGASLGDKESKEIYKNIPEYQKQDSLVFVMNGEILSIPMPQELSSVVAPFRQFVEYLNDSQPNDFWELMTNDLLSYLPVDLTGYTAIDMNTMSADPTVLDRLGRGTSRVFSQLAPVPVKTTYMLATGIDPYTGKNMNDPSYWYWDEENGSLELMDYTQNRFAKAIADTGFLGKNATVWEKVFSGIFGKTSTDVLDDIFEMFMEGPDAGFNTAGENLTKALTNPFTVEQYDLVDRYWKDAVKSLTAEKNAILQDPRVQKLNSELAQTKDTEKRKKILAERSEFTDDFYKKVDETARRLTDQFKGTFDRYKFAAVIQLLNFNTEPGWQSGTQESSDEASGAFYTGRDAALQMMSQMGIESSDDLSVFGYVAKDKNGDMVMKYNTPSTILDMKNNQMGQSNFHLSNIKSMVSQAGLYDKHDSVSKQISAIYDKAKKTNSDYQTIEAIQINWNAEVAKVLADYINKYSAEAAINNKQVRDYLKSYIEVPASWEKNNKGKRVYGKTLGDRGSLKDAYYSSWLKTMFGINDPYKGQY